MKTTPAAADLSKFPGTAKGKPLYFPPATVYFDIPNGAWRIKSEPGSRRTELVKFKLPGSTSKAQWQRVVRIVKGYGA